MSHDKSMRLESSAFKEGETIPPKHTCDGIEISPPLYISGVPEGAKSLALIMEDPDAVCTGQEARLAARSEERTATLCHDRASPSRSSAHGQVQQEMRRDDGGQDIIATMPLFAYNSC